ncbi:MAG: leucine-rich repeat protein [Clostridia bacterium]|nr:leucine-rich repeat protein [Clostridia bacterium]
MKKVLCAVLMLLMLLCLGVQAETAEWDFDTLDFRLNGYLGEGGAVVIPESIDGCTVDILGMYLFNDADTVASLTLPATLKQVEDSSVAFCDSLTELIIPEGVQIIGDNCFIGNPGLTEVTIPASVRYIGTSSFGSNESLQKVTFLGECPVFAGAALDWIATDAVVYVPDDQYDAYAAALYEAGCYSAVQPSGANAIVYDWSSDPSDFEFDAETGTITLYVGTGACVEIPEQIDGVQVSAIGDNAFYSDPYLCWLTLPEGLETIGESAFEWCSTLVHVEFPSTLKTVENRAFYAGYKGYALDIPAVETIGDEAFAQCIRITDPVVLPEGLKTVGNSAFEACSWLGEVYFPSTVESIGENAFTDSALNYLVFNGLQLPQMADSAIASCWYLTDIDLNSKASKQTMLDMQARVDAMGLDCRVWRMQNPDVDYIYDGLDTYENGVLTAYEGEQTHLRPWDTYDDITVTAIGEGVFKGSQTIEYFSVPYNDQFTTIGAEAFAGSSLRTVDLFDSVTTIGAGAFSDCVNIEELILPESVTDIGEGALRNCTGIDTLVLPASVTSVGSGALAGCTGLNTLTVLCDPSILPADLLSGCSAEMEIYAAENASAEQLAYLSVIAGRAWNNPVTRIGEPLPQVQVMPYEPLPGADFWYDTDFARIDSYQGYELNLILPREIDGTALSMLGGGMMGRAAVYDEYDAELPVVSLVIPETYTEIPPYAFENCETLETVICYAPIELLPDSAFSGCTNLREVVFVNGVRSIGMYVFDGCASLKTVYVGPYTQEISEYAFTDMNGDALWSVERCITDPALMPDVEALLAAVKRDPMPEPEPTPAPAPAEPVGEEGAAFFGLWIGTEMDMGGEIAKLSDWDMIMNLLLLEDGRMVMMDEEVTDWSVLEGYEAPAWRVENGVAIGDTCTMTVQEDGRLVVDEDGFLIYFERSAEQPDLSALPAAPAQPVQPAEPVAPVEPEQPAVPAEPEIDAPAAAAGITGVRYICDVAYAAGYPMYPAQLGEYSVIFYEGGTADIVISGIAVPGLPWTEGENSYIVDYYTNLLEFVWAEDGCTMNFMDAMDMHFVPEN